MANLIKVLLLCNVKCIPIPTSQSECHEAQILFLFFFFSMFCQDLMTSVYICGKFRKICHRVSFLFTSIMIYNTLFSINNQMFR